jgi:hypothetical protein
MRRHCRHLAGVLMAEVVNPVISRDRSTASEIFSYWLRLACTIIVSKIRGITEIFGSGSMKIFTPEFSRSKERELLPIFHIIKRKMLGSGSGSKFLNPGQIFRICTFYALGHLLA